MHAAAYGENVMPLKRVLVGNTSGGAVYNWIPARQTPLLAKVYANRGEIVQGQNKRFGVVGVTFEFRGRLAFSYAESRFRYQGQDYAPVVVPLTPGGTKRDLTTIPCVLASESTPQV